jgi:O-antigen ligase
MVSFTAQPHRTLFRDSRRRDAAGTLSLLCLAGYLIFLPRGEAGVALLALAAVASLWRLSVADLCIVLLIAAPPIIGEIFSLYKIGVPGSVFPLFCGAALAVYRSQNWHPIDRPIIPFTWLFASTLYLILTYFWGPQSEYSSMKIFGMLFNIGLYAVIFSVLFRDKTIDPLKIGKACIVWCGLYLSLTFYQQPDMTPETAFALASARTAGFAAGFDDSTFASNSLGNLGSFGCISLITYVSSGSIKSDEKIKIYIWLFTGFLLLNIIGARLYLILPVIVILCTPFFKSVYNSRFNFFVGLSLVLIFLWLVTLGLASDNPLATQIFASDAELDERLNRAVNWRAAIEIFSDRPWFGHGLGGFYVPGLSAPGQGLYAHNIFLEVLTEGGMVGSFIVFGPLLIQQISTRFRVLREQSPNGLFTGPFYIMMFGAAMISHDLVQTGCFLAICAVAWNFRAVQFNSTL